MNITPSIDFPKRDGVERLLLAVAILALYLGTGIFDHDIWAPTEPAVNGVVWEMFRYGSLAVPKIDGMPYLEKPPLYYWCAYGICKATGMITPGLVRLPAVLFGLASLAIVYYSSRKRHGDTVAPILLLMAATSVSVYEISHRASTDAMAILFTFAGFAIFLASLRQRSPSETGSGLDDLFLASVMALSFYCKNLYPILIVYPPVLVFMFFKRHFIRAQLLILLTTLLLLIMILPWCFALYRHGGFPLLGTVFFDNTIGRFFNLGAAHTLPEGSLNDALFVEKGKPIYYYIPVFADILQPWFLFFLAAAFAFVRRNLHADDTTKFLFTALVTIPIFLTLSSSKASDYMLPIIFIVLMITGEVLRDLFSGTREPSLLEKLLWRISVFALTLGSVAMPAGLAWYQHNPSWLLLLLPVLAITIPISWKAWHGLTTPKATALFIACVALLFSGGLAVAMPLINRQKSDREFFERIRPEISGRELSTPLCNDRLLPLITTYLDRRVPLLNNAEDVFLRLKSQKPEAVIVSSSFYQAAKDRLDTIPHDTVTVTTGRGVFLLLKNQAASPPSISTN